MDEIWKDIPDFSGYQVSNLGRARGPKGILKPGLAGNGKYMQIGISKEGHTVYKRLHILICTLFNGPKPSDSSECLHRNDNKHENTSANLYWGDATQNAYDGISNGKRAVGESHKQAKVTWEIVREIRRLYSEGKSARSIGIQFGLSNNRTLQIIKNEAWREEYAPVS